MEVAKIAKACHNFNKIICETHGDFSIKPWEDCSKEMQDSTVDGVQAVLDNPDITAEQLHANWMNFRREQGWVYGNVKDEEAKTHPCMVEYKSLPKVQQLKDHIFREVVYTLSGIKD